LTDEVQFLADLFYGIYRAAGGKKWALESVAGSEPDVRSWAVGDCREVVHDLIADSASEQEHDC
jgi:hypothetical protein